MPTPSESQKGFAVVIALSLLAFLLLLVLSLTALTRVSTVNADRELDRLEARQNALLGLLVGLGNVQRELGPDQRATANAGILSGEVEHPHWLGAFRWDIDAHLDPDPTTDPGMEPTWLASGEADPRLALAESASVAVVTREEVEDPTASVRAETEPVGDGGGLFAWWVGDESQKAKVNLSDPLAASSPAHPLRHRVGSRSGFERLVAGIAEEFPEEPGKLSAVLGLGELLSLDDAFEDAPRRFFHDWTTFGAGLLTNAREGGLRADLTALFEEPSGNAFENFFDLDGSAPENPHDYWLYRDPEGRLTEIGPNFGILRDYYRQYLEAADGSIASRPPDPNKIDLGIWAGEWPMQGGWPNENVYHENSPVHPVMFLIQLSTSFEFLENVSGTEGDESLSLRIKLHPVVGLYNPYNASLEPADYTVEWGMQPNILIEAAHAGNPEEVGEARFHLLRIALGGTEEDTTSETFLRFETEEPIGFGPGEIKYLVPSAETRITYDDATEDYVAAPLVSDSDADGFLYFDVADGKVDPDTEDFDMHYRLLEESEYELLTNIAADRPIAGDFGFATAEKKYLLHLGKGEERQRLQAITHLWDNEGGGGSENINARNFGRAEYSWPSPESAEQTPAVSTWAVLLRTTNQPEYNSLRLMIDANLRATTFDAFTEGFYQGRGYGLAGAFEVPSLALSDPDSKTRWGILGPNDAIEPEFQTDYNGLWGNYYTVAGQPRVVLFDVPRTPLVSIGELQHAPLSRFGHDPAYLLGHSYASVRVPRNDYVSDQAMRRGGNDHYFFDLPYLINRRFWDNYYFSTMNPDWPVAEAVLRAGPSQGDGADEVLPNSRLGAGDADRLEAFLEAEPSLSERARLLSAFLRVDGAFNVNSLSLPAWRSILSSVQDLSIPWEDPVSGDTETADEEAVAFSRLPLPMGPGFDRDQAEHLEAFWRGYRRLSDVEIEALAQAIVTEVKERGPFLSLGDFVNRRLESGENGLSGPLQEALDRTVNALDPSLGIDSTGWTPDFEQNDAGDWFFDENISELPQVSRAAGHTGYLLQGDLLQVLAPILTTRGDTFRIRGYGETSGARETSSRALCEAIVQRVASPTGSTSDDPSDWARADGPMGRQFRVVAFRWLEPEN